MFEFIEAPMFTKLVAEYLDDEEYSALQKQLNAQPESGAMISGSGGVRKLRWALQDKGKRGGLRIIYYLRMSKGQIWMLTLYAKNEAANIPAKLLKAMKEAIEDENPD